MSENNVDTNAAEGAETTDKGLTVVNGTNVHKDEKNASERVVGGNVGIYNHKFKKPFEYEEIKYTVLNFNFEKLTGRDMISIETEMLANNEYALDPMLSRNFQSKMAARAGGIGADALEAMPMQEFNKITNAARNFLIDSGY